MQPNTSQLSLPAAGSDRLLPLPSTSKGFAYLSSQAFEQFREPLEEVSGSPGVLRREALAMGPAVGGERGNAGCEGVRFDGSDGYEAYAAYAYARMHPGVTRVVYWGDASRTFFEA